MTPEDAGQLVTLMRGTWSRFATDDVAARLWVEDLCGLDSRPAFEAFRSLRDSQDRAPAWSLFRESYLVHARRWEPERDALEAGPDIPPPTEEQIDRVRALVRGLKAQLTAMPKAGKTLRREPARPSSDFDPTTPMLTYEEVYESDPAPAVPTQVNQ